MKWADGISILLILLTGSAYFAISQNRSNSLQSPSSVVFIDDDTGNSISLDSALAPGVVGLIVVTAEDSTAPAPESPDTSVSTPPAPPAREQSVPTPSARAPRKSSRPAASARSASARSMPPPSEAATASPASSPEAPCVNINTADERQLTALRGIGPATAAAIVAYRAQHGNFRKKEDIQKVRGIGPAKFAQVADHICL